MSLTLMSFTSVTDTKSIDETVFTPQMEVIAKTVFMDDDICTVTVTINYYDIDGELIDSESITVSDNSGDCLNATQIAHEYLAAR